MKIGIMTQPIGTNYGGIMQNYALQQLLKDWGHSPTTLLRIDMGTDNRSLLQLYLSCFYLRFIRRLPNSPTRPVTKRRFNSYLKYTNQFIRKHISSTPTIADTATLSRVVEEGAFDAIIIGSDQTWRPSYSPSISDFFLSFLPDDSRIRRIAYASSFGTDQWEYTEAEEAMARRQIGLFDAVSVREESGVELCRKHLDVEATFVLDPTLLISKAEYIEQLGLREQRSGKVFAYLLDPTSQKQALATRVADSFGTTYYEILPKMSIYERWKKVSDYQMQPVEQWLEGILNAEFVVTDSFHGAVFSVIFGKPFVVVENRERGQARFSTLRKFVSPTPFIEEDHLEQYEVTVPVIDSVALEALQARSLRFLREALG